MAGHTVQGSSIRGLNGDYDRVLAYLAAAGLAPNTQCHPWIGWRSIYVSDPDGNTVEFACHDPAVSTP